LISLIPGFLRDALISPVARSLGGLRDHKNLFSKILWMTEVIRGRVANRNLSANGNESTHRRIGCLGNISSTNRAAVGHAPPAAARAEAAALAAEGIG
jgi:hypothetical protein